MKLRELYLENNIKKKVRFNNIIKHKNQGGDCLSFGYDEIYDEYFEKYRDKKINLAEIGIFFGDALFIYSKYFKDVKLYGYDINTKFFHENQKDPDFLSKVQEIKQLNSTISKDTIEIKHNFDIIIDDGCHKISSMKNTFNNFFPKLKEGGTYFIEDVKGKKIKRLKEFFNSKGIDYEIKINKKYTTYHHIFIISYQNYKESEDLN